MDIVFTEYVTGIAFGGPEMGIRGILFNEHSRSDTRQSRPGLPSIVRRECDHRVSCVDDVVELAGLHAGHEAAIGRDQRTLVEVPPTLHQCSERRDCIIVGFIETLDEDDAVTEARQPENRLQHVERVTAASAYRRRREVLDDNERCHLSRRGSGRPRRTHSGPRAPRGSD